MISVKPFKPENQQTNIYKKSETRNRLTFDLFPVDFIYVLNLSCLPKLTSTGQAYIRPFQCF